MALVLQSNKSYNGAPSLLPQYNIINGAKKIYATYLANPLYKGSIAEIVNSSGEIKEIKAGDDGFLSATELVSFANGGNVTVRALFNQNGDGGSASRTDANFQPLIVENGSVVINRLGKPSIRCVNARGLIDRDVTKLLYGDRLQYFVDAEPVISPTNKELLRITTIVQGAESNFNLFYGVSFDTFSRITTQNYGGSGLLTKIFSKQETSKLVALFEYNFSGGYIFTDINGLQKKETEEVRKPLNAQHISIASAGPGFNDTAKSFDGVFNCLIIR